MKEEMSEEAIHQERVKAAIKLGQDLPESTFAAVPDEDIVDLQVSGQFSRVLNRTLEYLYQSEPEDEVLAAADAVKNNFENMKQEDVTLHQIALWCVSHLLADFSVQSGLQNKSKIYDRDRIMTHIFGGVTSNDPLKPLTQKELDIRLKEERTKMKTEIKEELKADAKKAQKEIESIDPKDIDSATATSNRDKRRDHRDAQRDEDTQKDSVSDDLAETRKNKPKKDIDEDFETNF